MASPDRAPKLVTEVPRLAPRPPEMHKGQVGRVAIVAGSRGMSGAACLSALGALRGGAGLVRVYTPASVQPIVAASEPCLMTVPLPEDQADRVLVDAGLRKLHEDRSWPDVLAIGPGLGQAAELAAFVRGVLEMFEGPVVIDADGLNNLTLTEARQPWWTMRAGRPTVVTPHPGEMERLRRHAGLPGRPKQDDKTRLASARDFAQTTGLVTVLKGHHTVVASPEAAYVNTTGNPGMATGGMGDVLTGLLAALIGQGLSAFEAACLAVYCHGAAADLLVRRIGPIGYLAREVADVLPSALAQASRLPIGFK